MTLGAGGCVLGLKVEGVATGGAGAAAAADNTEEAREARELEKMFLAHLHRIGVDGLLPVLAAADPPELPAARDAILAGKQTRDHARCARAAFYSFNPHLVASWTPFEGSHHHIHIVYWYTILSRPFRASRHRQRLRVFQYTPPRSCIL